MSMKKDRLIIVLSTKYILIEVVVNVNIELAESCCLPIDVLHSVNITANPIAATRAPTSSP
jgi:hypothetical protein